MRPRTSTPCPLDRTDCFGHRVSCWGFWRGQSGAAEGGLAALARNRRIMASSASGALPPALGSPAPFSMLQMSCRGSRRSRFYGQNAELASHDCGASEGSSDRRELSGQLRRSDMFIPAPKQNRLEPHRGGMARSGENHAAPTELARLVWRMSLSLSRAAPRSGCWGPTARGNPLRSGSRWG
jgi:hypothetical protein